ncbi:MAG: HAMP domain-containing sensor histidine kinase [bacterium]
MKIRRLKISQQLMLVFFIGVILPLCITAMIVVNVNQHAVRAELRYSAIITTDSVYQRLEKTLEEKKLALLYIAKSMNYIIPKNKVKNYLSEIIDFSDETVQLDIIKNDENINKSNKKKLFNNTDVEIFINSNSKKNIMAMYVKLNDGEYLRKFINIDKLKNDLFKYLINDKRQVYIIDSKNNIVMSYNEDKELFRRLIPFIPKEYKISEPVMFGKIKNEPNVFLKLNKPDWAIVVTTPKQLTHYGIIDARLKIIVSILASAIFIIVFGILYSYSLNTNLAQLFKSIAAIGKGNYRRKVRLLKDFFTPYEIVFLMSKFNDMAQKIDEGYMELQEANEQLSKLDKMKSNLIDTVSHEFRTPLTCIKGYTSRLLRSDINVNEEMKIKSLKVIKQQTERLSRLVDDLLVVPEIEADFLRVFPSEIDLKEVFENCIFSMQQKQNRVINFEVVENLPFVWADPDRVVQIVINLLENAIKYSPENSEIDIKVIQTADFAVVKIRNDSPVIEEEKLHRLFEKFVRLEDDLTRTTRGTGLGLFIVRGLIQAMGGTISLSANQGFEVSFTLPLAC